MMMVMLMMMAVVVLVVVALLLLLLLMVTMTVLISNNLNSVQNTLMSVAVITIKQKCFFTATLNNVVILSSTHQKQKAV